jgi:putative transposase
MHWVYDAYCLMTNHYHLVSLMKLESWWNSSGIPTKSEQIVRGTASILHISRGMRQFNGVYTQPFNRHHGRVGHVFHGRYKAILVDREPYLQQLER